VSPTRLGRDWLGVFAPTMLPPCKVVLFAWLYRLWGLAQLMQKAVRGLAPQIREKPPFLASQARLVQEGALRA